MYNGKTLFALRLNVEIQIKEGTSIVCIIGFLKFSLQSREIVEKVTAHWLRNTTKLLFSYIVYTNIIVCIEKFIFWVER